jgi:hypothetical protein
MATTSASPPSAAETVDTMEVDIDVKDADINKEAEGDRTGSSEYHYQAASPETDAEKGQLQPEQPDAPQALPSGPPGREAPDGGFEAWLVAAGVWCTSFCSFGWLNSETSSIHLVVSCCVCR